MNNDIEILTEKYNEILITEKLSDIFGDDIFGQQIIRDFIQYFNKTKKAQDVINDIKNWLVSHPNQNILNIIKMSSTPEEAISNINAKYAHTFTFINH